MELLIEKGAFLSAQMTGISPELAKNPVLTPFSLTKLEYATTQSQDFVRLVKEMKPKLVFQTDALGEFEEVRKQRAFEKWWHAELSCNFEMLKAATSTAGELLALSGKLNPYPDVKLGVIEEGAYADILLVDGNPLEDISVIGGVDKWFDAPPRDGVKTIRLIMKDGKFYKNTLGQ